MLGINMSTVAMRFCDGAPPYAWLAVHPLARYAAERQAHEELYTDYNGEDSEGDVEENVAARSHSGGSDGGDSDDDDGSRHSSDDGGTEEGGEEGDDYFIKAATCDLTKERHKKSSHVDVVQYGPEPPILTLGYVDLSSAYQENEAAMWGPKPAGVLTLTHVLRGSLEALAGWTPLLRWWLVRSARGYLGNVDQRAIVTSPSVSLPLAITVAAPARSDGLRTPLKPLRALLSSIIAHPPLRMCLRRLRIEGELLKLAPEHGVALSQCEALESFCLSVSTLGDANGMATEAALRSLNENAGVDKAAVAITLQCRSVVDTSALSYIPGLACFIVPHSFSAAALVGLAQCRDLRKLVVSKHIGEWEPSAMVFPQLEELSCTFVDQLHSLEFFTRVSAASDGAMGTPHIMRVDLRGCAALEGIAGLCAFKNTLTHLNLSRTAVSDLYILRQCTNLLWVDVSECDGVTSLSPLGSLPFLEFLDASRLDALSSLDGIADSTSLEHIRLVGCKALQNLSLLRRVSSLLSIDASRCTGVTCVDGLDECPRVRRVVLEGCTGITNWSSIHAINERARLERGI